LRCQTSNVCRSLTMTADLIYVPDHHPLSLSAGRQAYSFHISRNEDDVSAYP
jgi:hypothetical protein